ncbi:hypothetical protein HYC85_030884 [Camellia sinensis]|uniref:Uncharacterized protein n=1 Tax=Camellia sinensis TaxID=4442 RepID=A0A7J7FQ47_CAMSI|nr:hypothetical protein HYC85_030884 [Camellia sinensis]
MLYLTYFQSHGLFKKFIKKIKKIFPDMRALIVMLDDIENDTICLQALDEVEQRIGNENIKKEQQQQQQQNNGCEENEVKQQPKNKDN